MSQAPVKVMKVGTVIRLNPEMFKKGEFKLDNHYGNLGYPGLFRDWLFKVLDNIPHSYHGDTVLCEPINVKDWQGQLRLRTEEVQPAVLKRTVEYQIISEESTRMQLAKELDELKAKRVALKATGRYKLTGRTMKANQAAINAKALEIEALANSKTVKVHIPKIKKDITIERDLLSKKDELEMLVSSAITSERSKNRVSESVTKVQGFDVKKLGGVNVTPNTYGKIFEQGLQTFINQPKVPTAADKNYLGIEIECIVKCTREELKKIFIEARLHKHVNVTDDGSINVDQSGYNSCELRILASENELESVMMKVQRVLNDKRVKAYANRSCGIHVHIDQRNRDAALSYKALFNVQSLLRKSQPEFRQLNSYCKRNKSADFQVTQERNSDERYSVINTHAYKKFKTLEVRVHEGTVNCVQIINWCKFLSGVVDNASKIKSPISSMSGLRSLATTIPEVALSYIQNRIEENGDEEVGLS